MLKDTGMEYYSRVLQSMFFHRKYIETYVKPYCKYQTKVEQIIKAKVLGRALSIERTKIMMNCGKTESMDNYCGLSECNICDIDRRVEELDMELNNFCSPRRNYSAFENALEMTEKCCESARADPVLLVTHEKWPISVSKILMEALRESLETYATTGKTELENEHRILRSLDFVYGKGKTAL